MKETPHRSIGVVADELFSDGGVTFSNICTWLSIPQPPISKVASLLRRPANPQVSGDFGSWETWSKLERDQFAEIVGDLADQLGYKNYAKPDLSIPSS